MGKPHFLENSIRFVQYIPWIFLVVSVKYEPMLLQIWVQKFFRITFELSIGIDNQWFLLERCDYCGFSSFSLLFFAVNDACKVVSLFVEYVQ